MLAMAGKMLEALLHLASASLNALLPAVGYEAAEQLLA